MAAQPTPPPAEGQKKPGAPKGRPQGFRRPLKILGGGKAARIRHLLDMQYSPSDLADDLGLTVQTVYHKLIPAGLPATKDAKGRVWIYGPAVREWFEGLTKARRNRPKMPADFAYCASCRQPRKIAHPRAEPNNRFSVYIKGQCSKCGHNVARFARREAA